LDATGSGIRQSGPLPGMVGSPPFRAGLSRVLAARAPRPALQGVLAFAIYLAVFIIGFALPLISNLDRPDLGQYWTDPNFYTWALRWWPYAVSHGINPLVTNQIGAPGGDNLAWATTTPSVGLLMWPVTAAFGVLVSFNLMVLLVPPVSALTAFIAARRLTGQFWPALLAGVAYGFCPFEMVHSWQGQPNLTVIALLPVLVYLVLRWWDGTLGRTGFVIWMALVMALEFYTFNEAFAEMTLVGAAALVAGLAVAGRAGWRKVARLGGLTAVAYAGALLLSLPYLLYALRHYPAALDRQRAAYSLWLVRLVLPWSDKLFGIAALIGYSNGLGRVSLDDYVGIPLLLMLLALALLAWSSRLTRLLVIVFVLVIALAAGPSLIIGGKPLFALPWGGLWSLPVARSAEPSRLIVFGYLILALALALWLAGPAASGWLRAARWGLGLLAVAAMLAGLPTTSYQAVNPLPQGYTPPAAMHPADQLPAFITNGLYRHYLSPGETVVVVTRRGNAGMLFQADAGFYFKIAGGFINASLSSPNGLPRPVELLTHATRPRDLAFLSYVRAARVGAVIVEQAWAEPWMGVFGRIGLHGTAVGGVIVYPTGVIQTPVRLVAPADERLLFPQARPSLPPVG
jgi:hypothetical protein